MAENIRDYLIEILPEKRSEITKNCDSFTADLISVMGRYSDIIDRGTVIVTSHDAFSYLADDLGITVYPILGLNAEGEPSPARVAEVIEFCKMHRITTVFTEYSEEDKIAETIARECGIDTTPLFTVESEEDGSGLCERIAADLELISAKIKESYVG